MVDELVTQLEPVNDSWIESKAVLIVDDDEAQVAALEHRLRKLGFETMAAHSGAEGIRLAINQLPDLVLLDLRLPDADGFEVCSRLADAPETCGTPVIIPSAMERPDIIRRSRAVGCEYYVRKPYDPNVLLTLIQNALDRELDW